MCVQQTAKLHWKQQNNKAAEGFQPRQIPTELPPQQTIPQLLEAHQQYNIIQC
jgi:hypothetical protein